MRDPKRIPVILEELRKIWMEVPDERFWQFLMNLSGRIGIDRDPWFIQDDEALMQLQALRERWVKKESA